MGGYATGRADDSVGGHFNGRIENPRVFDRVLSPDELEALKDGEPPTEPVAAWDFSVGISSREVSDTSSNRLHGRAMQRPTRGVTGHNWTGHESHFERAPAQYAAIHFHDDDLDDAGWDVDFEYEVPAPLRSGVYAVRLRAGARASGLPQPLRDREDPLSVARTQGEDQEPLHRRSRRRRAQLVRGLQGWEG